MALVTALTAPITQIVVRNYVINNIGIASAGYWQGMIRISDGYLLLVTTTLSTYYLPKLSSIQKQSELRKEIFNGYKITLPIVLAGCIIVYLFRTFIIKLLFTSSFLEMEQLFFFQMLGDFIKIAA
jgi:PST family polysaccharide transporter